MTKDTDKIILVADYGRSGQGWLSYMLCYILNARYLEPYCLLRGIVHSGQQMILDYTQGNLENREQTKYSLVVKTHNYPDPYFSLTDKVILLARDPRDVAVSAYARLNVASKTGTDVEVGAQERVIGGKRYKIKIIKGWRGSIRDWVWSGKIRRSITDWLWTRKSYYVTARGWGNFYEAWDNIDFCHKVTYEELSLHPKETLQKILHYLGVVASDELIEESIHKFTFENITKRQRGNEAKDDVAFRKGIVGDFRNHFSKFDMILFKSFCEKIGRKWGYAL